MADSSNERSGNQAEEEFDPARHAAFDLRFPGGRGHEMAAGLTLVQRDAVHMNLLAGERPWLGQLDGIGRDAPLQEIPAALGQVRGFVVRWVCRGME